MLYAIVGVLVIIADQWVKFWTATHVPMSSAGEEFIPGILSLANVHNEGAAFGFLSGSGARIPFIILAGVFALVVIIALATGLISGKLARWSIVLVTAGGLSNCLDRIIYGYVQDMFKCEFINFPVFNVADIFITVFAIVFALAVIFGKTRRNDDDDDYEFEDEEDEEEEPRISRRKQKRLSRRAEKEEDEEEDEAPPVRVKKEKNTPRSRRREKAKEAEEAEVPAAAATKKEAARQPVAEAPKQQKAPADAKEDPFAAWERSNNTVTAQKPTAAKQQAAKPASEPAATRRIEKAPAPAAPVKPAAPAAKPAAPAKPAAKPVVEEEFSLDDILNEFR